MLQPNNRRKSVAASFLVKNYSLNDVKYYQYILRFFFYQNIKVSIKSF